MSANELLGRLAGLDIRLGVNGDMLRYDAPAGVLTPILLAAMREHKVELLRLLRVMPILIDLETRSAVSLRDRGGRRYATDPSTAILSCVALIDGQVIVWAPLAAEAPAVGWPEGFGPALPATAFIGPDLPRLLAQAVRAGRPFCSHNAREFDQPVWAGQGLPEPAVWVDTLPWARAAGLPGALEGVTSWLLDACKDPQGQRLIDKYSRPFGKARQFHELAGEDLAALVRYNLLDVLLLSRVYPTLAKHDTEPGLLAVDAAINGRGIHLDRDLARAALALEAHDTAHLARLAEEASGGAVRPADLTRTPFLGGWLESRGIGLGRTPKGKVQLTKAAVADLLRRKELPPGVREVLAARKAVGRTTTGKLRKALYAVDPDGRLRHQLLYHKAHPGRWAGREVQPQNLPKPHPALGDLIPLIEAAGDPESFRAALPGEVTFSDGLSALVRPSFAAALGQVLEVADYASVEARGVAWLAGEEALLAAFREGRDVYRELAGMTFGKPPAQIDKTERAVGKQAVLGAGYGMGPGKFAATCEANGVDLAAAGVTAEQVVDAYRDAYPKIAGVRRADGFGRAGGLWKDVEAAALAAVRDGRAGRAGRCEFSREGNALVVTLPSGRRLFYRHARIEPRVPGFGGKGKPTLVYDNPEAGGEKKRKGAKPGKGGYGLEEATYGGKLTENITQAVCRDLLAGALLSCERAGLHVVLHAHDEVVIEVEAVRAEEGLRRLAEIMSAVPPWAAGFPVAVEGYATARYLKNPPPGAPAVKARDGEVTEFTPGVVAGFAPKAFAAPGPAAPTPPADTPPSPALPFPEAIPVCESYAPPPLRWYGGKGDKKSHLGRSILALAGGHPTYCEPFAGGLSCLLAKPRARVEVVNDLDPGLVIFWRVVRDDMGALLALIPAPPATPGYPLAKAWEVRGGKKVEVLNPASKPAMDVADAFAAEQFARAKECLARGGSPAERAACLFLLNRCSFGGQGTSAYHSARVRGGNPEMVDSYLAALAALPKVSARLRGVEILNENALDVIARHRNNPDADLYNDPPFLGDTRGGGGYTFDMREEEKHVELIWLLDRCRARVLLEGYWSAAYERLLDPARWQRYEKGVKVSIAAGEEKGDRVQCVWVKEANE